MIDYISFLSVQPISITHKLYLINYDYPMFDYN